MVDYFEYKNQQFELCHHEKGETSSSYMEDELQLAFLECYKF